MKPKTQKVINLRMQGKTYKEIVEETGMSKGNISYLCNRYVPDNSKIRVKNHSSSITNERLNTMRIAASNYYETKKKDAINRWIAELSNIDECLLYYIRGLYDGEGNHSGTEFSLSNSDRSIVKLFIGFLNSISADYSLSLYIHSTQDQSDALDHWKDFNIRYVYQKDSRTQLRDYSAKENYGTVKIRTIEPLGLKDALFHVTNKALNR